MPINPMVYQQQQQHMNVSESFSSYEYTYVETEEEEDAYDLWFVLYFHLEQFGLAQLSKKINSIKFSFATIIIHLDLTNDEQQLKPNQLVV